MSEDVIDRLEAIKIHKRHDKLLAGTLMLFDARVDLGKELAAIGQPGQAVSVGQALILFVQCEETVVLLTLDSPLDNHAREVPLTVQQERAQGDRNEGQV